MSPRNQEGFALVTVLMLLALLMALSFGYFTLTRIESSTTRFSMSGFRNFYAAEGGLGVRGDDLTGRFTGFSQPSGTSPSATGPCQAGNNGTGDFRCTQYTLEGRSVDTYVVADPSNPRIERVPRGEPFQNLIAESDRYILRSRAVGAFNQSSAGLSMLFRSRRVPLFSYAVFFDKDLEIDGGHVTSFDAPIYSNGDIYIETTATLDANAQLAATGSFLRGRKEADSCASGTVRVRNPETSTAMTTCPTSARHAYSASEIAPWRGMIRAGVPPVTVPPADFLAPSAGNLPWDRADLRIVLDLTVPEIKVRNVDGSVNIADSTALAACPLVAAHTSAFYNVREASVIEMLDIDLRETLDCIYTSALGGVALDDTSDGGLVLYLGVTGPLAATMNNYGVRIDNADELASTSGLAPPINGLTIATDQALYLRGDFNSVGSRKPAALLTDSVNVLSEFYTDTGVAPTLAPTVTTSGATINAALLAGTDSTGGAEGASGRDSGGYNGGMWNVVRLHEDWTGRSLNFSGSFVSLQAPRHVNGAHVYGGAHYRRPNWNWSFDSGFSTLAGLPPLTPRMTYLQREIFVEQFDL